MNTSIYSKSHSVQVSILMITYNHEKYIEQAIQAVLAQKTKFAIELLICNDSSTDQTAEIVGSCIQRNSSLVNIRYEHHHQNIGMMQNFKTGLELCAGKYIALCEGDDYWTDPYKLQKQLDFLEANPTYFLCHHDFVILNEEGKRFLPMVGEEIPLEYDIIKLAEKNIIGTLTVMFRNCISAMPSWFSDVSSGDYALHLFVASHGCIKYIPEVMAVYRKHSNGVTSKFKDIDGSLFLINTLQPIVDAGFIVNLAAIDNLNLQLIKCYSTVFGFNYLQNNYDIAIKSFNKIAERKNCFIKLGSYTKEVLQVYLWAIKIQVLKDDYKTALLTANDFTNNELQFLLKSYAEQMVLNRQLKMSISYRFGNLIVKTIGRILPVSITNK